MPDSILLDLAEHTEGRFYGVTLSGKQREVALQRARQRGLDHRVRVDVAHVAEVFAYAAAFYLLARHPQKDSAWVIAIGSASTT